jgi:hypothetical protein
MKKLLSMIALAAICTGSVYAGPSTPVKAKTVVTDTVKKKMKMKTATMKKKVKTKNDTTKVKMKSKM